MKLILMTLALALLAGCQTTQALADYALEVGSFRTELEAINADGIVTPEEQAALQESFAEKVALLETADETMKAKIEADLAEGENFLEGLSDEGAAGGLLGTFLLFGGLWQAYRNRGLPGSKRKPPAA